MATTKKRITGTKGRPGFQREYKEVDYLKALSGTPKTTKYIREIVGCSHDTASKTLKRLSDDGLVNKIEIDAATGTGKMNLWTISEEGRKKLEENENDN